jgi:hypothetical protein
MLGQERVDDLAPQGLDGSKRAGLVSLDEAGIANDVCRKDRDQPPFDLDYPMAAFPAESQTPCWSLRTSATKPPS